MLISFLYELNCKREIPDHLGPNFITSHTATRTYPCIHPIWQQSYLILLENGQCSMKHLSSSQSMCPSIFFSFQLHAKPVKSIFDMWEYSLIEAYFLHYFLYCLIIFFQFCIRHFGDQILSIDIKKFRLPFRFKR